MNLLYEILLNNKLKYFELNNSGLITQIKNHELNIHDFITVNLIKLNLISMI